MNIKDAHLESKKRIGTLKGQPVIELKTTGGFHMIVSQKNGQLVTLGTGPHRAVARAIAKKREPDMTLTELSKSDWVDELALQSVTPKYEAVTDAINALLAG